MSASERTDEELLHDAIEALQKAETVLATVMSPEVRKALRAHVDHLDKTVPDAQSEMRIARMRILARLKTDPDRTPAHPPPLEFTQVRPRKPG